MPALIRSTRRKYTFGLQKHKFKQENHSTRRKNETSRSWTAFSYTLFEEAHMTGVTPISYYCCITYGQIELSFGECLLNPPPFLALKTRECFWPRPVFSPKQNWYLRCCSKLLRNLILLLATPTQKKKPLEISQSGPEYRVRTMHALRMSKIYAGRARNMVNNNCIEPASIDEGEIKLENARASTKYRFAELAEMNLGLFGGQIDPKSWDSFGIKH